MVESDPAFADVMFSGTATFTVAGDGQAMVMNLDYALSYVIVSAAGGDEYQSSWVATWTLVKTDT